MPSRQGVTTRRAAVDQCQMDKVPRAMDRPLTSTLIMPAEGLKSPKEKVKIPLKRERIIILTSVEGESVSFRQGFRPLISDTSKDHPERADKQRSS
jgi:hypothetical protein